MHLDPVKIIMRPSHCICNFQVPLFGEVCLLQSTEEFQRILKIWIYLLSKNGSYIKEPECVSFIHSFFLLFCHSSQIFLNSVSHAPACWNASYLNGGLCHYVIASSRPPEHWKAARSRQKRHCDWFRRPRVRTTPSTRLPILIYPTEQISTTLAYRKDKNHSSWQNRLAPV